jgi:hypothetical protein
MRTIRTKVYSFDELSKDAQEKAIEKVRNSYYKHNDFARWAIDDCYLFEPKHEELVSLFGADFYEKLNEGKQYKDTPLIQNTREDIFFNAESDRFLDCEKAMKITNSNYFLKWLGIEGELLEKVDYTIFTPIGINRSTTISFGEGYSCEFTDEELDVLKTAYEKFDNHVQDCLNRIEEDIDYRFTDEAIIEDIIANEYEFLKDGTRY